MKKKVGGWKKAVVAGALTASLGLGFWASKSFYTVREVYDGDTFVTTSGLHVRLDNVNAPEIDDCLGKEAKDELSKLVLNKKVFIKVALVDPYKRVIASVYTTDGSVQEKLLKSGLAIYERERGVAQDSLFPIAQKAKEEGLGVYSSKCTQLINPTNSKCDIKGNTRGSSKIYQIPGCRNYENTLVQLHLNNVWFCTEKEAKAAGFVKSGDCL